MCHTIPSMPVLALVMPAVSGCMNLPLVLRRASVLDPHPECAAAEHVARQSEFRPQRKCHGIVVQRGEPPLGQAQLQPSQERDFAPRLPEMIAVVRTGLLVRSNRIVT